MTIRSSIAGSNINRTSRNSPEASYAHANSITTDQTTSTLNAEETENLASSVQSLPSFCDINKDTKTDDKNYPPHVQLGDWSSYWDPASMAPLSTRSVAAIARLRAFRPPAFPAWDRLPLSRRAAVLILLYADHRGELRVVLTMRAASLRNYSGHAAFPGGKADTLDETPEQIARREAWEEIGLPMENSLSSKTSRPFRIEHLCMLPHSLAKTELAVRPCVALLQMEEGKEETEDGKQETDGLQNLGNGQDIESLIPRLDAKEVAAVFSAPFHNFLLDVDELDGTVDDTAAGDTAGDTVGDTVDATVDATVNVRRHQADGSIRRPYLPAGSWYEGTWIQWHARPWRMHYFYVPIVGQRVAKPMKRSRSLSTGDDPEKKKKPTQNEVVDDIVETPGRYKVWGMTARILVDAAQLAYGEKPTFEHNAHFGDEQIIEEFARIGRLDEKKPGGKPAHEDTKEGSKI